MGTVHDSFADASAETRELAWELKQDHPDQMRIRFLIDNQADLKMALSLADLRIEQISKMPVLRQMHLEKIL
jgi:hypothetical protein